MTRGYVQQLCDGTAPNPSATKLLGLAQAFGVSPPISSPTLFAAGRTAGSTPDLKLYGRGRSSGMFKSATRTVTARTPPKTPRATGTDHNAASAANRPKPTGVPATTAAARLAWTRLINVAGVSSLIAPPSSDGPRPVLTPATATRTAAYHHWFGTPTKLMATAVGSRLSRATRTGCRIESPHRLIAAAPSSAPTA